MLMVVSFVIVSLVVMSFVIVGGIEAVVRRLGRVCLWTVFDCVAGTQRFTFPALCAPYGIANVYLRLSVGEQGRNRQPVAAHYHLGLALDTSAYADLLDPSSMVRGFA
jgi:hypothetical protein